MAQAHIISFFSYCKFLQPGPPATRHSQRQSLAGGYCCGPLFQYQAMGPAQPLVGTTVGPAHNQPSVKQQPDVVQSLSRVWFCDLMDCSTRLPPVLHHLLELSQTHVYWVGDAIQPSHPLLSPSPPALNMSANLENSATGLEKVSFHSNPKERQCQRMLKLSHNCTPFTC